MTTDIAPEIVDAAMAVARDHGRALADVSLAEIAQRAGVSRATLYRRIGSRKALDAAVRAAGVDPGNRPDVRERAVEAAAAIVRERGFGALTLEAIAARAGCSIPALHSQLGGRDGVIVALFERYSPLPRVEQVIAAPSGTFEETVRALYLALVTSVWAEPEMLAALMADALARPDGPTARIMRGVYFTRILGSVGRWLAAQMAAGQCRRLPLGVILGLFAGPVVLPAIGRVLIRDATALPLPEPAAAAELFAEAFCCAVALPQPLEEEQP